MRRKLREIRSSGSAALECNETKIQRECGGGLFVPVVSSIEANLENLLFNIDGGRCSC